MKMCRNLDTTTWQPSKRRYGQRAIEFTILLGLMSPVSHADNTTLVKGSVEQMGDTTHLEFVGRTQWVFDVVHNQPNQIKLTLPTIDTATQVRLKTLNNELIKTVQVNTSGPDHQTEVIFQLADEQVESFDYLTDDPSRLILDFYRQNKTIETLKVTTPKPDLRPIGKKTLKTQLTRAYKKILKAERRPAGSELLEVNSPANDRRDESPDIFSPFQTGSYDGSDPKFERFLIKDYQIRDEALIASRQNIYIRFPMLKLPTSQLSELETNPPEYVIKLKNNKESKEAKLILTLYQNGRYGLLLKASKYFLKVHPDSIYDEIIHRLMAETNFVLYRRDGDRSSLEETRKIYRYLVQKYPSSVLTERSELLLADLDLEDKNGLQTIQSFSQFIQKYPQSSSIDAAKKALAEGYLTLNKYDDALKTYQDLKVQTKNLTEAIEAEFRFGDVYMTEKNYPKAEEAYAAAIKNHPGYDAKYANASFNMAEAEFWLGHYKDALTNYVTYLKNFPSGSHGGYAMTRIGEVLEILGADQKQVMGAFLESTFRYQGNPGADVAFIRMTAQRMKGMKDKELRKSVDDMDQIAKNSSLPDMNEFVSIMKADGYRRRGDYQTAMNILMNYYQANPMTTNLEVFKKRILGNVSNILREDIDQDRFLDTLRFAGQYENTWLKNSNRIDIPYYIGRAYEQSGVLKEAESIFQKTLSRLQTIAGHPEEKERRVFESLPSRDSLELRLASLKTEQRNWIEAQKNLQAIKNPQLLSDKEKVERIQLVAQLSEARGDLSHAEQALKNLISTWKGQPQFLMAALQKLGELYVDQKKYIEATKTFEQIVAAKKNGVAVSDDIWARNLRSRGDLLIDQNKDLAATEVYQQLLDEYEDKRPLGSIRYRLGDIFYKKGDLKTAQNIWAGLDGEHNQIYHDLAQEKIKSAEWQDEYHRYIQRIPAMTKRE